MESAQIFLASRPKQRPKPSDFGSRTAAVPALLDGDLLLKIRYLSLDPYMRGRMSEGKSYAPALSIGDLMVGGTVGEVLDSRHNGFEPNDLVLSYSGWQSHAVAAGGKVRKLDHALAPVTTALGVLGMPGFTAWTGLLEIGRPQPGECVVVAAATGPVGSAVGQIARVKGARAVGIAGGPEKCAALRDQFGFDVALDHRAPGFAKRLEAACPDGIDVYFENVGGTVWDAVFPLLNTFARVPVCGLVADYNTDTYHGGPPPAGPDRLPFTMRQVLAKSLTLRGFIQTEFVAKETAFLAEMARWVQDGTVKYKEDIVAGLATAPEAFIGLLDGKNFGKLIVRI